MLEASLLTPSARTIEAATDKYSKIVTLASAALYIDQQPHTTFVYSSRDQVRPLPPEAIELDR